MSLTPGERLGPYHIVERLGAGGMGEVYKARDTRLDRSVAIKVAQDTFGDRVEREARAASALNHPNIAQVYDVGPNYLVMELVEGAPIAPVDSPRKLLDLAVQLADGLSAAHAAGIVHRDLKPDNVLVTRDGRVKILDFGLAKQNRLAGPGSDAPTVASTEPGTILGTVSYMSPEQARGEPDLTPQSDQFSLGIVLHELASGQRPFSRGSGPETMAAIIRDEAEPLPTTVPAPLRWVIARLLSKEPGDRYDSTRDLHRELRQIRERLSEVTNASAAASAGPSRRRRGLLWPAATLAAGLVAGAALVLMLAPASDSPTDLSSYRFTPVAREESDERTAAWSPDGRSVAYTASVRGRSDLFVRLLGAPDAAQITRDSSGATNPAWSPDGSTIYFNQAGGVWAVGSAGGTPELIFDRAGHFAVHPDGQTFVFVRASGLWRARPGEEPRSLDLPEGMAVLPAARDLVGFSPDGTSLAGLFSGDLWLFPWPSGAPRRFAAGSMTGPTFASWLPDNRRLVLTHSSQESGSTISILDTADGSRRVVYATPDALIDPAVSPDGRRLLCSIGRLQWNLLEVSVPGGAVRTLLATGGVSWYPAWAPSGTRYVFATSRTGRWAIEEASASDNFFRRLLELDTGTSGRIQWSPDGNQFLFEGTAPGGASQLMLAPASGGRAAPLDPDAAGTTTDAVWSPDGRHIIYARRLPAERQLQVVRTRPGSSASPEILVNWSDDERGRARLPVAWHPSGDLVLTRGGAGGGGLFLVSPDFSEERQLTARAAAPDAVAFSSDGRDVLTVHRSEDPEGVPWQLWATDGATGRERKLADLDIPVAAAGLRGFSLHPDGTRFATSVAMFPFDIWMIEGFDP